MNFELKLALKYLSVRRKSLARFTSLAAIIGIAAGVAGLILAQALARGFQTEIQNKLLANHSHITIYQIYGEEIKNWRELKQKAETIKNITQISPASYENSLLVSGNITSYAVIRLKEDIPHTPSANGEIQIHIGANLAEKSNLKIGDQAEIIIPTANSEFAPKTSKVKIAGIFQTGLYDYDSIWIYVSAENLARIFQRSEYFPSVLSVSVKDVYASDKTSAELRLMFAEDFKIVDWQEANRPLFAALSLEKKVAFAIISLIIFIAALNITTTLSLLVNERRLDIAVLRACGAKTKSIIVTFLFEGILLGLKGIFLGVICGLALCYLGNYLRIISLPNEVYSLNFVPLLPTIKSVLQISSVTFLLILISTIYPAWKAAKIKPLENLRNQ